MKKMLLTGLFAITMLASPKLSAQWVVTDPTNFAQSIINTTQQIVQTSSTAKNMLNNFREVEKLYNQGKEYYDALKKVNNLVKDARKVQETVLLVGDISKMYVTNFKKMSQDLTSPLKSCRLLPMATPSSWVKVLSCSKTCNKLSIAPHSL